VSHAILTHGGAASPHHFSDGCVAAAERAHEVLAAGGDALAAVLAATVALEDDPRFNAGTGSNLRLDGRTIEMDASVMTGDGRFGAVGCVTAVKNPVLVAARVMETPHLMLVGAGATAFARRIGFAEHDPSTPRAREKYERAALELAGRGDGDYAEDAAPWRRLGVSNVWNLEGAPPEVRAVEPPPRDGCDTVGAVVRDAHGAFAATASTGGTLYMLRGRVGDAPIMGAGVYAGPHGAVAATGVGEEIVKRFLSKTVYDWLVEGVPPEQAAQRAITMFPDAVDVGLLVVGRSGHAIASNRSMASATREG
jgi:L-asparaginase / beta-aspartyl-peptidase